LTNRRSQEDNHLPEGNLERKLTTVLIAIGRGYICLIREDEAATLRILMTYRQEVVDGSDAVVTEVS
jgi:hypothetical protein